MIPEGFSRLVDETVDRTGLSVGMNAVDGFGADRLASGQSTYEYSELWGDHEEYSQVKSYLAWLRTLSGNKPSVIAGYVNNTFNHGPGHEAESAEFDAMALQVARDHSGFSGDGFVDHFGEIGDVGDVHRDGR